MNTHEKVIENTITAFANAWNVHDAKMLATVFTEDANLINFMGTLFPGRTAIEVVNAGIFATVMRRSQMTFTESTVKFINPDVAIVHAVWTLDGQITPEGNDLPQRTGRLTVVATQKDDNWRIEVMQNTEIVPMPSFIKPAPEDLPIQHQDDPRVRDVDPGFRQLISGIALAFGQLAKSKGMRATHSFGTTAQGVLEVLPHPDIPRHHLFVPGKKFPVLVRHANIKGFKDDGIRDGRGATLRLLHGEADASLSSLNLNKPLLDVLLGTGKCFIFKDAATFGRWVRSTLPERAEMLKEFPRAKEVFEEVIRNPESYTKLHYYSQTTYLFMGVDGKQCYLRYRLINADKSPDTGFMNPTDLQLPVDYAPRPENDGRPETYLQNDFCQQVEKGGLQYLLQVQFRGIEQSLESNELAKDCTVPWDEEIYPLRDLAVISLKSIIPNEIAEPLEFNAYNAPADLAMILAKSSEETASINHIRSVVYEISANMRNKQQPNPELILN